MATVAVHLKGGRCPCCVSRAGSTVASRGGDSRVPTAAGRRENRAVHRVPHFMAVAVEKGFFARNTGLFRTPSTWIAATLEYISTETSSQYLVRTTTTTSTTSCLLLEVTLFTEGDQLLGH